MVALAVCQQIRSADVPPAMPADIEALWGIRLPVMRAFPRLAVECVEAPLLDARPDEEPERWDGMA